MSYKFPKFLSAVTVAASVYAIPTFAEQAEENLIVVASKQPLAAYQVGRSVAVMDRTYIEQLGYQYAADLFRHIPGVAVTRTGGFGGVTELRLRGGETNHTLVLIDGVDVSAADSGQFDFASLLAADIERIEVLRGGHSGIYGSNATAGVILIQTKSAQGPLAIRLGGEVGEHASRQLAGSVTGGSERFQGRLSYTQRDSEFDVSADDTLGAEDDQEENRTLSGQFTAALSERVRVDGYARFAERDTDTDGFDFNGGALQGLAVDANSRQETEDLTLALLAQVQLTDQVLFGLGVDRTETESDGGTFGSESSREQYKLDVHYQWAETNNINQRTTLYAQWEEETYKNLFPFDPSQIPEQSRDLFGVGVEHALTINNVSAAVSLRLDDNDKFEDATTYGLSVAWQAAAQTTVRASFSKAITNPTFFEQFGFTPGTFVGNPDLEPEESTGWEVGVTQAFLDGNLVVDAAYFSAELEEEIVSVFPSVQNTVGQSERDGLELSLAYQVSDQAGVNFSYTYTKSEEPAGDEVRRPEHMASLDGYLKFSDAWSANGSVHYSDERLDTDFRDFFVNGFVSSRTALDSYVVASLKVTFAPNDQFEAYVRLENAFDEEYEEVISYALPGRSAYLGFTYLLDGR